MTTKKGALYKFWSSFGLPAYNEQSVPEGAELPYITYEVSEAAFGERINLSASIWSRSTSWAFNDKKLNEISEEIGRTGKFIDYDKGCLWILRGVPFGTSAGDLNDSAVKRTIINIMAEFESAN